MYKPNHYFPISMEYAMFSYLKNVLVRNVEQEQMIWAAHPTVWTVLVFFEAYWKDYLYKTFLFLMIYVLMLGKKYLFFYGHNILDSLAGDIVSAEKLLVELNSLKIPPPVWKVMTLPVAFQKSYKKPKRIALSLLLHSSFLLLNSQWG